MTTTDRPLSRGGVHRGGNWAAQFPVRRTAHRNTLRRVVGTFVIERELIGYTERRGSLVGTPRYRWNLYDHGVFVDTALHPNALIWGARRAVRRIAREVQNTW